MYFQNITSLADLKKQYRQLAIANHPDKGGSTETMQTINAEFDKLFNIWKDRKEIDLNGYENDYNEAKTSRQYTEYVYNEYRWRGSRCGTVGYYELANEFRKFVKEAYPNCKFSITKHTASMCLSYYIALEQADFEAFTPQYKAEHGCNGSVDVNHYHIEKDDRLTERCKEVMANVIAYCQSFNYDNSDAMVDYFDVGFYSTYSVGTRNHFFKYQPIALKGGKPEYQRKPTKHERLIQQAIGAGNIISEGKEFVPDTKEYKPTGEMWLIKNADQDIKNGWAITYSQPSLLKKRLEAMRAVGIICEVKGCNYCRIKVLGYTPELQAALNKERAEEDARERAFYEKANNPAKQQKKAICAHKTEPQKTDGKFEYIDYSERAFVIKGDTRPIAELLKSLGGRFNPRLTCGAGWVFPKSKEQQIREKINIQAA